MRFSKCWVRHFEFNNFDFRFVFYDSKNPLSFKFTEIQHDLAFFHIVWSALSNKKLLISDSWSASRKPPYFLTKKKKKTISFGFFFILRPPFWAHYFEFQHFYLRFVFCDSKHPVFLNLKKFIIFRCFSTLYNHHFKFLFWSFEFCLQIRI